jgi:hypothetical protein
MSLDQITGPTIDQTGMSVTPLKPSQDDWNRTTERQAIGAATGLSRCWRKDDAHNPETFGVAVAAVFTLYSPDVVQYVCDPRVGLPKTHKWAPAIAEVHEALANRVADLHRKKRYENWGRNDPEQRERLKDQGLLPPPVVVKPTLEELKAKYGPNWGIADTSMRDDMLTRPKPDTKEQAFIDKVRAETVERQRLRDDRTCTEYHNPGSTAPKRRLEAEVIIGVDGNPVDQGADF